MNKYLEQHLIKYPHMQIEDKIKLLMQGHLGPGHLVNDYELVLKRVSNELHEIQEDDNEMIEEISDNYVRVYLKPYYAKNHSFDKLVQMFIESSKEEKDYNSFFRELELLKQTLNDSEINYLDIYLESDNYLISHSKTYRDIYHPHYLVIHKKYI